MEANKNIRWFSTSALFVPIKESDGLCNLIWEHALLAVRQAIMTKKLMALLRLDHFHSQLELHQRLAMQPVTKLFERSHHGVFLDVAFAMKPAQ